MSLDFSPFGTTDDLPGDPVEAALLGKRYVDTADEIKDCASRLRTISGNVGQLMVGKTAEKFPKVASDLADRISKAEDRYRKSGEALKIWSGKMDTAQWQASQAAERGRTAAKTMADNAPPPPPALGDPPLTEAQKSALKTRSDNHTSGSNAYNSAQTDFDNHKGDYQTWAKDCAKAIDDASHDDLKDGFWYRHFHGWAKILTIVAIALVVVAVVILVCVQPELLVGLAALAADGGALGAAAGVTGMVLGSASTFVEVAGGLVAAAIVVNDLGGKAMGFDVSKKTIALDIAGAATFGLAKFLLAPKIARSVEEAATAERAAAQSDAFEEAMVEFEARVGSKPFGFRTLYRIFAQGGAAADATKAGEEAAAHVTEVLESIEKNATATAAWKLLMREGPGELAKMRYLADINPDLEAEFARCMNIQLLKGGLESAADLTVNANAMHDLYKEMVDKGELDKWLTEHDPGLVHQATG